jgi:hypothetical protein
MSGIQEKKEYTAEEKAAYRQKKFDRYNTAYEEAANVISKGGEDKIKKATEENKSQAILYTFYFMQDRNATQDTKGVKISFGDNIRMYDILTKGKGHFLRVLNTKFNKESENKYHCGFFRRVNPDGNGFNEWNIYVSWKNREFKAKSEDDGFVQVGKKNHFEKKPFEKKPYVKKPFENKSLFKENDAKVNETQEEVQQGVQQGVQQNRYPRPFQGRGGRGGFHHRGPYMGGGRGYNGHQGRGGRGGFQPRAPQQQQFKAPTGPTWASKLKGGNGPLDKKEESQTHN